MSVCLRLALLGIVILFAVAAFFYQKASKFDMAKVAQQEQSNVLLDKDGTQMASLGPSTAKIATFEDLPEHLKNALLAREDSRFYDHCGVDGIGLARATVRNIKDMSFTQGASTLSMQLARNTYEIREKSLYRKLLEIALTLRVESHYSKEEIMTYYLNRIYFGSGCYGIEEASQHYFGVPTNELDLGQSATIVGIIRGPHIFSPFNDLPAALEQRNQVLARMVSIGMITQAEADEAKETPLKLSKKNDENKSVKSYALNAIHRHLDMQLRNNQIIESGLNITTTISAQLLQQCESDIAELVKSDENLQAAAIVIENKTGAVRALVGGRDYETTKYNFALDGQMDLGEAFTPFIYLAALERRQLPIKNQPVKTGKQIGQKETLSLARRFGLKGKAKEEDIFYGTIASSPLDVVTAFSVIGNGGKRPHTFFIKQIAATDGKIIFENNPDQTQVVDAGNADECLKFLDKSKGIYSNTASAFGDRALWAMTTDKKHTALLWLGYESPKPIPNADKLMDKMKKVTAAWLK